MRGFQILELTVTVALLAVTLLLIVPPLLSLSAGTRVRLAAGEVAAALRQARSEAVRRSCRVGVKFFVHDKEVSYAIYTDGDGDGVRTRDIRSGADRRLTRERPLRHLRGRVGLGFPAGPLPPDPGNPRRRLRRPDDPIRFNRSDIASFDPLGTSTPGSVYLSDGRHHLAAVRLYGRTGKVKVLLWDPRAGVWRGP